MFSHFFIRRPIFASVLSIVIVILGGVAVTVLPIARYPEIAPPTVQVTALYPGAAPQVIAETVATPIEQEVNGVEGMLYMTSTSSADGTMTLTVTFGAGVDLDMANVLVQNRVSLAEPKLPEEVRRLGVTVKKRSSDILVLVNLDNEPGTGERYDEAFLNDYAASQIRDELTRISGVGDVTLFGAKYAMRVWLDPDRLRGFNLSTNDVVAAIREQNVQVASGKIGESPAPETQSFEYIVTTKGRLSEIDEFSQLVIKVGEQGRLVRLADVARVELGQENYGVTTRFDGRETATFAVYQLPGSNAVETANRVKAKLDELSRSFPPGVRHVISYDGTAVIVASLEEVMITLFITLVIVVATVYVFLQDLRATVIPAVTIPVSLIGTFAVMLVLGYSLNILTLFGLVLVIGIVVDDAIVVVENVSRLMSEGKSRVEAAKQSMIEVSGPVVATTLVLLAVFVPTIFMGGIVGELFRQFAVTISIATVFSSLNALTLSPALCAVVLRPPAERQPAPFRLFNWLLSGATRLYGAVTGGVIRGAALSLLVFFAVVGLALWQFVGIPSGFVPQEDEGYFIISAQLPDAATLARTEAVAGRITEIVSEQEGVDRVVMVNGYSFLDGTRSSNTAGAVVTLTPWDERPDRRQSLRAIVGQLNRKFYGIQDAFVIAFAPPSLPGIGFANGLTMQLQDRGDQGLQALQDAATRFSATANEQAAFTNFLTTFRANVPQLYLDLDREQAKSLGLSLGSVFDALSAYLGSVYINDFTRFGRIYQVRAQAEGVARATPDDITSLEIRATNGEMIPLSTLIAVEEDFGPTSVTRFNLYPAARVNGQTTPGFSTGDGMQLVRQLGAQTLPESMSIAWTDVSYQEAAAQGAAGATFIFSIILVYLVLAAQYESWTIPFAVVGTVPAALLGAVIGVLLRGFDNNVYTQIGVVLLIGLSAKTAILIVEFAKTQRESGLSLRDAAVSAGKLRFRAVLMTAFSFILGVIPLAVATGAGAASRQVLGTVVLVGMLAATVLGVLAAPLLFYVIQGLAERFSGRKSTDGQQTSA